MPRKRDLHYGARAIRDVLAELRAPAELADLYAEAVLAEGRRNAAGRPTPQAPMAARNMTVSDATIYPRSLGAAADVALGSEFGSNAYPQFHRPPSREGYWLYPATRAVAVLAEADAALEDVLKRMVSGG